jgi:ABC-type multidrug transport system ATPase subunit
MLKAVSLTKHYGRTQALRGLDFEVNPGETVALLGANGAGKTTTIRLLLGLTRPTAGSVLVSGASPQQARVRRRIGYSPESPRFHEFLGVDETLRMYAELSSIPRRARQAEADRVMALTGLSELRERKVGRLSKESQRSRWRGTGAI